ncbi:hypothetical protein FRB95_009799 [Tulasnella sp. JGI-2019a]|nr:hypothetical protein FRB93_009755 [Tulasnella sp. JGI-2019a]KAG9025755.1 hypothetical protein FRB95_009799 [Tulasnella sp. JGI-2019a]
MLFIPELVQDVMDYLHSYGASHHAIDDAGLVCKPWREAALTSKWRDAKLVPLISLLVGARVEKWAYSNPLSKEDWGRFDNVARRVITLHAPRWCSVPVSVLVAMAGSNFDRDVALFPRLRTLDMEWSLERDVTQLMAFLPENLERFDVGIDGGEYEKGPTIDFMALLPQRFGNLSELALYSLSDANDDFTDAIATVLPQLPKLRHVWLSSVKLTSKMAVSLAGMSFLEELHLRLCPTETVSELLLERWNPNSFPTLSTLNIPMRFEEATASLLYTLSGPNFRSLSTLKLMQKNATSVVEMEVDRVLRAIQVHSVLLHLTLESMDLQGVSARALHPLSSLHKLKTLEVSLKAASMRIHDTDVEELLEHLPNLESLTLALEEDSKYILTLKTLVSALNLCPLLSRVGLLVDASTSLIPEPTQLPHRNIRSLAFGDLMDSHRVSHLESAAKIAAFISKLSDNVLEITWGDEDCCRDDGDGDGDRVASKIWQEVHDLVPIFQEVRRYERMRFLGGEVVSGYPPANL